MKHCIGGASVSVEIQPISEDAPTNPRLAADIQSFLSMLEKADFCGKDLQFSTCLAGFLDEVDNYLDDNRLRTALELGEDLPMDEGTVREMEEFMDNHLPASVRRNLKKLGRK